MLVSFSVSNFRSFGEEVTLNMVANNRLTDHPGHRIPIPGTDRFVLRSAVLYGANAAGKSNLVHAMSVAQRLILNRTDKLPGIVPFRFGASASEPSSFEFRFLLDDRVYIYGFDATSEVIHSEWLAFLVGDSETLLFERTVGGVVRSEESSRRFFPNDSTLFTTLATLAALPIRPYQLFLNRVMELPEESQGRTMRNIIHWLTKKLVVYQADSRNSSILDWLEQDYFRVFSESFLHKVGTGLNGLRIEEELIANDNAVKTVASLAATGPVYGPEASMVTVAPNSPNHLLYKCVSTIHSVEDKHYSLLFTEESDGTKQLLYLLPILFDDDDGPRTVVIDELDRSLHPLLCWEFLRFFSGMPEGERRQLVVTTHEAHLLNQELLRRDEYWFVEKDKTQQTRLSSLDEFNVRNDLQLQKGYLQGRFGGIPVIGSMEALKKLLENQGKDQTDAAQA